MKATVMDMRSESGYRQVLDDFGGEEMLREKYPRILQMLEDTRAARMKEEEDSSVEDEEPKGYEDAYWIDEVAIYGDDRKNGVYARSKMSLIKKHPKITMISKTYDEKTNKVFGAYSISENNACVLDKKTVIDHSIIKYTNNVEVKTRTSYYCLDQVDSKFILAKDPVVCESVTDISSLESIVKRIEVHEPKALSGANTIRIVYNDRSDKSAAYTFKKAGDRYFAGTRYVEVFYPFLVEVELANGYTFDDPPVRLLSDLYMSLASDVVEGGEVHFNTGMMNNISYSLPAANRLMVDFSYNPDNQHNYWGVDMPLTDAQAKGDFDFHLNFDIYFRDLENKGYNSSIIVTSASYPPSENTAKVDKSNIKWGCIGAGAMIWTKEGEKDISKLNIGDMIYTENGYRKLINLVTGNEREMISISVDGHEPLLISKKHAIPVERGIVEAGDVVPEDRVRLYDGRYVPIKELKSVSYDGKVYSPELGESDMVFANGIMVGDYLTRADCEKTPAAEEEVAAIDPELWGELNEWEKEWETKAMAGLV